MIQSFAVAYSVYFIFAHVNLDFAYRSIISD